MKNKTKGLLLMSPALLLLIVWVVSLLRAGKGLNILLFIGVFIASFLFLVILGAFVAGISVFFDGDLK